jgi:hypothetical protein
MDFTISLSQMHSQLLEIKMQAAAAQKLMPLLHLSESSTENL